MFVLRAKHVRLTQSKRILEFTSVTLEMFLLISAFEMQQANKASASLHRLSNWTIFSLFLFTQERDAGFIVDLELGLSSRPNRDPPLKSAVSFSATCQCLVLVFFSFHFYLFLAFYPCLIILIGGRRAVSGWAKDGQKGGGKCFEGSDLQLGYLISSSLK